MTRFPASLRIAAAVAALLVAGCGAKDADSITFSGTMDVNTVRISAQVPGTVIALATDEGRAVKLGDTLAVVETEKLGFQIDQNRATLEELDRQSDAAQATLRAAVISRDNVQARYKRYAALLASNAATQQSVDDLKTQLDAADEQIRSARISLTAIESRKKQVESGAQVLRRQVKDATIVAPADGIVIVRYTDRGELVGTGSPLFDIADLGEMWTKIYIGEKELPFLKLGQRVALRVDGMPDRSFEGTVTWISDRSEFTPKSILTEETRTTLVYPAKVTVKNPDGVFKIGMPVTVTVPKAH